MISMLVSTHAKIQHFDFQTMGCKLLAWGSVYVSDRDFSFNLQIPFVILVVEVSSPIISRLCKLFRK